MRAKPLFGQWARYLKLSMSCLNPFKRAILSRPSGQYRGIGSLNCGHKLGLQGRQREKDTEGDAACHPLLLR